MPGSKLHPKRPGLPPGSAVFAGEQRVEQALIRLVDFDEEKLEEMPDVSLDAVKGRAASKTVSWIDVVGLHDVALVKEVCDEFGVHPLTVEDILNPRSRAKLEDFESYAFFTMRVVRLVDHDGLDVEEEAVSVVLGPRFVLTFQETQTDCWDPVRERVRNAVGRIRRMHSDYFAYALLDAIVDQYFLVLEQISTSIQALEDEVLEDVEPHHYEQIHDLRRVLLLLYKATAPFRETVTSFERLGPTLVQKETRPYLRDVYDHAVQIVNEVELYRALTDNLVDIFHAQSGARLNQATMLLTAIATIFLPLTFIVGVYGMNFKYMPELEWSWGYPLTWAAMLGIAISLAAYFRRRDWL